MFGNFSFADTLVFSVSITTALLAAVFWTSFPFAAIFLGCVSLSGLASLFAYRAGRRSVVRSLFALFRTMRIPVADRPPSNEDTIPADLRSFSSELFSFVTRFESREAQLKQLSADTSHELRTPLAVIKGKVEIMLSRERDPSYYNARLEEILFHLESMQQIVDSILELSRLSFIGSSEWKEQVDLLLAADEACQFVSYLISGIRKQSLSRDLDFAPTFGNHSLLIRMIVNLIENASKFTPEGGELGVDSGHDLSKSVSFVRVWDRGKGMDEFAIRRCRDLFWRGDASRSSSGYGLGLSLVQRVVEIHGGEMEIESTLGKGSSFTVLFPLDTVSLSDYDA